MKYWIARCLAGTLGCGALAALSFLLAMVLSAGGDETGAHSLRTAALLLGMATAAGLAALVVMLSVTSLQAASSATPTPTDSPPS